MADKKKVLNLQVSDYNVIIIEDETGGITIKNKQGAMISVGPQGITLDNGQGAKIVLQGPSVNVNDGALEVI
jgi:hypothetical protein